MIQIPIYQVKLEKVGQLTLDSHSSIDHPSIAASCLFNYLQGADREHFVVMMLNTKNQIIGIHTAHIGSLSSSIVHAREVFKPAILHNSSVIIIGHNHPSGDPTPSKEDYLVTKKIVKTGEMIGIECLDHIIIGCHEKKKFFSLKSEGFMEGELSDHS